MSPAGQPRDAPPYLIGNHVIAERMYRHDPKVMLNAPPGTVIYADNAGRPRFTARQPGTASSSRAGEAGAGAGP